MKPANPGKYKCGQGEFRCPCCLPASRKATKQGAHRNGRRAARLEVKREANNAS